MTTVSAQHTDKPTISVNIPTVPVSAYKEPNKICKSVADDIQRLS